MPIVNINEELEQLLYMHRKKDLEDVETRKSIARDILATMAKLEKSKRIGATVLTESASMYDPKVDKVVPKPKSL